MSLSYLNNRTWATISREERVYCAELYLEMRHDVYPMISLLNKTLGAKPSICVEPKEDAQWEAGYEVCFYRDIFAEWQIGEINKMIGTPASSEGATVLVGSSQRSRQFFPQKRTFDLCLFSEDAIIVFEAKAHQHFYESQLSDLEWDKQFGIRAALTTLASLSGRIEQDVHLPVPVVIGLMSSSYYNELVDTEDKSILDRFDGCITWEELYEAYKNALFRRADKLGIEKETFRTERGLAKNDYRNTIQREREEACCLIERELKDDRLKWRRKLTDTHL